MTYRRVGLSLALAFIAVGAAALTGWTFTNWRESHAALQEFDAALSEVHQHDDPQRIDVAVTFNNHAESRTMVEFMGLDVYCRDRLILSYNWFPDDFGLAAGESVTRTFEGESNLPAEDLRDLPGEHDAWEARMRFRIAHPAQDDTFLVDIRRGLSE